MVLDAGAHRAARVAGDRYRRRCPSAERAAEPLSQRAPAGGRYRADRDVSDHRRARNFRPRAIDLWTDRAPVPGPVDPLCAPAGLPGTLRVTAARRDDLAPAGNSVTARHLRHGDRLV